MQASTDIVVVLPNWIGDAIMATPMLRALRKQFAPRQRLIGVMRPYVAAIFEDEPWFDEVVLQDREGRRGGMRLMPLIRHFRARRPETMVVLASSLRFGVLALLSGARRRIGYRRNLRGWMFTHPISFSLSRENGRKTTVIEQYLDLAYALGCPEESPTPELNVSPIDEAGADQVWANLGFTSRHRVIAINPGGANGTSRNWDPDRFVLLAQQIADLSPDLRVLMMCGPAERELAERVTAQANRPQIRSMAGQDMRLGVTKAVLRRATALVSGDHGLRHIAGVFATPTVCLEGPMDGERTGNGNPYETRVRVELPCMPCNRQECPLGHKQCMTDLTIDLVMPAVVQALSPKPLLHVA